MRAVLTAVALFILGNLLMPLALQLLTERAPKFAAGLLILAVRFLPSAERDRYLEEWSAELEAMDDDQRLSKLLAALRILVSAPSLGWVLRGSTQRPAAREPMVNRGYDAYLTYSHVGDDRLASALQHGLQQFAKPWYRLRALRLFRDTVQLAANPGLWASMMVAMDGSRYLMVLASPDAATSAWVDKEIRHWLATKPSESILLVLTDGDLRWDHAKRDFDVGATAVPPALFGVFSEEPRWVDMRWATHEDRLSLRDGRFRDAVADLAAPLRLRPKDDLVGEDVRQHRRNLRAARSAVGTLCMLMLLVGMATVIAIHQRDLAVSQMEERTAAQEEAARQREISEQLQRRIEELERRLKEAEAAVGTANPSP